MKKLLTFILSAIFLLGMFSCSKPSGDTAAQPTCEASTPRPYEPGLTYREVYNPDTDFDNRFGRSFCSLVETDDAYYFGSSSAKYLYYFDKAVGEYGVLCGKPECMHDATSNNAECNGYINSEGAGTVNYLDEKIYYAGYDTNGGSPCYVSIFRMNPDGSEHERVAPCMCDFEHYPAQGLQLHRGKLYGYSVTDVVVDAVPMQAFRFCSIDLATGEYRQIYERIGNTSTSLLKAFYFGKYVYICDSYQDYDAKERGIIIDIFRWDSEGERLEDVYHGDGYGGASYSIWVEAENEIYFASTRSDLINGAQVYCLRDGAVEVALTLGDPGSIHLLDGIIVSFWLPIDAPEERRMLISDYDGNIIYQGGWTYEVLGKLAAERGPTIGSVFGGRDTLYMVYWLHNGRGKDYDIVVKYDLTDPGLKATVLCSAKVW